MIQFLLAFLSWFGAFFRTRHDLGLELVAFWLQMISHASSLLGTNDIFALG